MERREATSHQKNVFKAKTGCEAKKHSASCPCPTCVKPKDNCITCPSLTRQHKVPKCIAKKIMGWKSNRTNGQSNIEWLSMPCHTLADKNVPEVYYKLRKEAKRGKIPTIKELSTIRQMSA